MKFIQKKSGLTLVELLVAISILTIVTALIIPRLRVVNKDRNIRETARIIGSAVSSARERAIAEGAAGIIIERNVNFVSTTSASNNVFYAGTRIYQMRSVPSYSGDDVGDGATVRLNGGNTAIQISVPTPLEEGTININDRISIGNGHASYLITSQPMTDPANPMNDVFTIAWDNDLIEGNQIDVSQPDFLTGNVAPRLSVPGMTFPFEVSRLPVKIESTVADLPPGYVIDLRYSGPNDPGTYELNNPAVGADDPETVTAFGLGLGQMEDANEIANRWIVLTFNQSGSLDRAIFNNNNELIGGSMYFFITEFDPNIPANDALASANSLLTTPESLWLTVGVNGGVNIGYNAPPARINDVADLQEMVSFSRAISRDRTSSNQ